MTHDDHLKAIATAQTNNSLHARNALVSLWVMGHHVEALFADCLSPAEVASGAGVSTAQVYAALSARQAYKHVRDIPA
ncbi:MAG: hypothetical protein J0I48_10630 [Devosia sp.]|uniref:hypothetical protein n=1 Tax=Devosia sp. 66-22 TaxID=1895753 RepID=UPI00092588E2|nr:hypothetical protein [Devosia sp. 66-22]MBN9346636.1 hypothetical protein [Devosia sp.]OJX54707.1 MAG: hypothetical protein BGO81_16435 [Devosia sp. 66-22]